MRLRWKSKKTRWKKKTQSETGRRCSGEVLRERRKTVRLNFTRHEVMRDERRGGCEDVMEEAQEEEEGGEREVVREEYH